jgi:meso-butanediol dehydrogenase / (S,S)-butanediol dehydrogenase / diacetyl reductase
VLPLDGKMALITGGGTGIGAAIARRLVSDGARVCVTGRRSERLQHVVESLPPGQAAMHAGDLADPSAVRAMVDAAVAFAGRLDIVVNNAAANPVGSIEQLDVDEWRNALDVNVSGPMLIIRGAIPHLRAAGGGSIVNVASAAGVLATPGIAAYCTSKAALLMLTKQAALDLGHDGIRVNAVCPGWVRTEMSEGQMDMLAELQRSGREKAFMAVIRNQALPRVAEPEEVAHVVAFLAGPDSSYMTASVLTVDGGSLAVNAGTTAISDAMASADVDGRNRDE